MNEWKFDIMRDSALEIANGLLAEAWGGEAPAYALDFPSATVFSRAESNNSDVHIEWVTSADAQEDEWHEGGVVSDDVGLDNDLARPLEGPSDTRPPFVHRSGESTPPGLFGPALRAYGEVMSLAEGYGIPTHEFDMFFRSQWGIDAGTDLSRAIPVLRSSGPALWGGMSRKLAPYAGALQATQKNLVVKWHTTGRSDLGDKKLADWPRLTALLRTIAAGLIADEDVFKKGTRRWDFRIVRREIPDAPDGPNLDFTGMWIPQPYEVRETCNAALEYLGHGRAQVLGLVRAGHAMSIEAAADVHASAMAISRLFDRTEAPLVPRQLTFLDDAPDLESPPRHTSRESIRSDPRIMSETPDKTLGRVMGLFVDRHGMLNAAQIRGFIVDLDHDDADVCERAEKALRSVVAAVVPDDVLVRFLKLLRVLTGDEEDAWKRLKVVLNLLKFSQEARGHTSLTGMWKAGIAELRTLKAVASELAFQRAHSQKVETMVPTVTRAARRLLVEPGAAHLGLALVIERRKNFWANYYAARGHDPGNEVDSIRYQLRGALFRATRFTIDDSKEVFLVDRGPTLNDVLYRAAVNFVKNQVAGRKREDAVKTVKGFGISIDLQAWEYARELDSRLTPPVPFSQVIGEYQLSVEHLRKDLVDLLDRVTDPDRRYAPAEGGDLDAEAVADPDPEIYRVPLPVSEKPPAQVSVPTFDEDDWGDDAEGQAHAEEVKVRTTIMLLDELADDHPDLQVADFAYAREKYGEEVPVSMYAAIEKDVRENMVRRVFATQSQSAQLEGHDLE